MANSLSEGFVRTTYTGITTVHHAIIPVNFDGTLTPGVQPSVTRKDATTVAIETGFQEFLDAFGEGFNDDTLFGLCEAYSVDPDTEERQFIYGWNANFTGTNASPNIALAMATSTFKTILGGILRIVQMEGVTVVNIKQRPPYFVTSPQEVIASYITSDDSIVIGRDNNYAFSPISFTTKTSDALRNAAGL